MFRYFVASLGLFGLIAARSTAVAAVPCSLAHSLAGSLAGSLARAHRRSPFINYTSNLRRRVRRLRRPGRRKRVNARSYPHWRTADGRRDPLRSIVPVRAAAA